MAMSAYPTPAIPQHATPTICYLPQHLFVHSWALSCIIKSFHSKISSAFSFYARELNLVSKCRQINKLYCGITKSRGKFGEENEIFRVEVTDTIKSFHSEISSAFSFYARELNLVSKCRQMNKLHCEIIKIRENYGKNKMLRVEITDTQKSLHGVLHSSL